MVQTMPLLFWGWYYGILFITFTIAALFFVTSIQKPINALTIAVVLLLPLLHLIQAIPRAHQVTEFQYFWQQLKMVQPLCLLILACYLYLLMWWIYVYLQLISMLFFQNRRQKKTN